MTSKAEELAKEYADNTYVADDEGCERGIAKCAFLAGYQAGYLERGREILEEAHKYLAEQLNLTCALPGDYERLQGIGKLFKYLEKLMKMEAPNEKD